MSTTKRPFTPAAHSARRAASVSHDYTDAEWHDLLLRQSFRCAYCGALTLELEADHMIPVKHWGGSNAITNILAACPGCNRRKGHKPIWEIRSPRQIKDLHVRYHTDTPLDFWRLFELGLTLLPAYRAGDVRAREALRLILVALSHPDPDGAMARGDALPKLPKKV